MTTAVAPDDFQKWRKKSLPNLEIEAVELTRENAAAVTEWCGGVLVQEQDPFDRSKKQPGINVPCEYGKERAVLGDFVFKTGPGQFRIRKPGEFKSLWEPKQ